MKDAIGIVVCGTRRAAQWRRAFREAGIEAEVVETDTDEAEAGACKVLVPRAKRIEANAIVTAVTRGERGLPGGSIDARAVEANDDITIDIDDRNAALAGFGDRFHHELRVVFDIFVGVLDTFFIEVIFGGVAESTPGCCIDRDVFTHTPSIALYNVK